MSTVRLFYDVALEQVKEPAPAELDKCEPNSSFGLMLRVSFWVILLFLSRALSGGAEPDRFLDFERSQIERIIEMGYNMDPRTAAEINTLKNAFPESLVPGLLDAGYLYWMQNYKAWDEVAKATFEEHSETALERAKDYLEAHPEDPDARFAVAMVELMQVIYYVDHHRWWPAFWKSRSSLRTMRRLHAEYPNYHDTKLPLGMHNCYMSRTPAYLKPLAFLMRFKGDWETGIRYMEEARESGLLCKVDAGYYLSAIRLELEGDRQASRDEMAKLVELFPGNLKFRAMLAELERGLGKQEVAMSEALEVMGDERLGQFPGIEGRTYVTLLWSSLGANALEITMDTAESVREFAGAHEGFDNDLTWVDFVEAEASWGLGRFEEAIRLWRLAAKGSDAELAATAEARLAKAAKPPNSVEPRPPVR
ncbi:hypothetical protein [Pelagicoccus sp. SDUM812002]|uniref:hypothetical protein n=1 Tax=Pelagicoccus sp. SDUM812002 TaxID=3041266 RepID=UPI00280E1DC0|nr:hypothetical protein [Pelagicoccus sp. SDUM812002]MDQ8184924.1 hypothetical protein [Pelagicoccus sp. SDUM812002]